MSVALATPFTAPRFVKGNRRAWPRLVPDQLQWLQRVRLTSGPAVSILDLSLNGALFEIPQDYLSASLEEILKGAVAAAADPQFKK